MYKVEGARYRLHIDDHLNYDFWLHTKPETIKINNYFFMELIEHDMQTIKETIKIGKLRGWFEMGDFMFLPSKQMTLPRNS